MPATLVIIDKGHCCAKLDLSSFLDARELSDSLGNTALVEDAISLPEDQDGICSFFHFLHS